MKIYSDILTEIPKLHGWCTEEKAICLANLVLAFKPRTITELGVWGGKSAIPMLMALGQVYENFLPEFKGKLICIDPWSPDESVKGQANEADARWWSEVANHELVYQHFKHTVERLGFDALCEIWRMASNSAAVPICVDLLHVDGNHGPQALADVQKFAPAIPVHGFCVLDDLEWTGGFVRQAETWLLENGFMKIHPLGTGAVYMRVK